MRNYNFGTSLKFDRAMWYAMLEWPAEWRAYLSWEFIWRKQTIMTFTFIEIDGVGVRVDYEQDIAEDTEFNEELAKEVVDNVKNLIDELLTDGTIELIKAVAAK